MPLASLAQLNPSIIVVIMLNCTELTFPGKSYDKMWSDSLCANIGSVNKYTIEDCKTACKKKSGCTAFNFCGGRIIDSIHSSDHLAYKFCSNGSLQGNLKILDSKSMFGFGTSPHPN